MYQVYITGYRLLEVPYTKPYYVYTIELGKTNSSIVQIVEKRYSEFNTLHRMVNNYDRNTSPKFSRYIYRAFHADVLLTLKKDTDTAPFPPKRVRNSQLKVLEQRRSALESYLQKMIRLASTKQQVLNFLGIDNRAHTTAGDRMHGESGIGDGKQVRSPTLGHHPVLTFQCDPYLRANTTSSLPDIITNGVLVGVYKS